MHSVPVEVTVNATPVRITNIAPRTISCEIDTYLERSLPITFEVMGLPAVGFESDVPTLKCG